MEKFSNVIKCRLCKCHLTSPVLLPCCHSVCKKHEQESKIIICLECNIEHEVPRKGFAENKDLALIISTGICAIDLGPKHKNAVESCNKMNELIEEVEQLVKDPINYIYEQIGELKRRIDLAREEFKLKIDEEAEMLLKKMQKYENNCKQSLKSSSVESKLKRIESKVEATKLDLDNWRRYLDNFKVNCSEYENIQNKCKDSIVELKNQLDSLKKTFLMKKIGRNEEVVKSFEKIGITFDHKSPIKGYCYSKIDFDSSDFLSLLTVLRDGTFAWEQRNLSIAIVNSDTLTILRELIGHTDGIRSIKELTDGILASASDDKTIKIWNAQSGQLLRSLEGHTDEIWVLEFLTNGLLASGSIDNTIKIWNVDTGDLLKSIDICESSFSLCLLRDGNLACSSRSKLTILNPQTNQIVKTIVGDGFINLCLLSDGNLAIGQADSDITIWDVTSWKLLRTLRGHNYPNDSLTLLNDGSLASGCDDGVVKIWNPIDGHLLNSIKVDDGFPIFSINQLLNGSLITVSRVLKFWE